NGACAAELARSVAFWPERDAQWFEDRIWIWLHYVAARLARGERLEALAAMSFIREHVLAPMATAAAGLPQRGLRRFEAVVPDMADAFEGTVGDVSNAALWTGLRRTAALYRELRIARPPERPAVAADRAVTTYIERLTAEFA
ncbi:MAG TPA: hypothetical protein VFF48_05370, partial [Brevundimonas sp.]|nr:hypothetical protein [Brevundimonas sp.]